MPVVLDDDPGERVLIYGADGSTLRKVVVNSSGQLVVVGSGTGGAVEVVQDTPGDLLAGIHGYDGSAWKKQGLIWAYQDTYSEQVFQGTAVVGTNVLLTAVVPAGFVYVVLSFGVIDVNNALTSTEIFAIVSSVIAPLDQGGALAAATWHTLNAQAVLKEGDRIHANLNGATAGDDLYLRVAGYKMKIAM